MGVCQLSSQVLQVNSVNSHRNDAKYLSAAHISEWQKNKSFKLSGLFLFLSMTNNCQVFFLMCHESEVIDNFGAVLNDSTKQVLNEFAKYKSSKIKNGISQNKVCIYFLYWLLLKNFWKEWLFVHCKSNFDLTDIVNKTSINESKDQDVLLSFLEHDGSNVKVFLDAANFHHCRLETAEFTHLPAPV